MTKLLKPFAILLVSGFLFTSSVSAQNKTELDNDPIAAMLDSLVSLSFLEKYSSTAADKYIANANYDSKDVPSFSDEVIAERMSKIKSPIPLTFNSQVRNYIDMYANKKRSLTSRALGNADLYFPMFEQVFDREKIPVEFKYLSIVESALNPIAVSHMGATGIWQFMYATGKMYDLQIDSYVDERRDVYKSTVAAAQYFKNMYAIYGDWLLVIAAYNCGPGNVNKAIARSGSRNFWELSPYLPAETRGYVPAFIAVTYVMHYANEHNIIAKAPALTHFEIDTVHVTRGVSFNKLASSLEISPELVSFLNPIYKRNYIPSSDSPQVLVLPRIKVSSFITNAESIYMDDPAVLYAASSKTFETTASGSYEYVTREVKTSYTVRRGDNLSTIASKNSCTLAELKKWNKLRGNTINAGQRLVVYKEVKHKVAKPEPKAPVVNSTEQMAAKSTTVKNDSSVASIITVTDSATAHAEVSETKTVIPTNSSYVYYIVQPGDTLWNIAQRYEGVTVQQIRNSNNISNTKGLKPGTKLKIVTG